MIEHHILLVWIAIVGMVLFFFAVVPMLFFSER